MISMLTGKKILLVEDEKYIRELFELYLKEAGYTVVTAVSGKEGVEIFKREVFDLVLLDIILPEKDGISVLEDMQKINYKVKVVMLTNLAQEELVKKAFDLGAVGYLLKARLTRRDLIREVAGFLDTSMRV